MSYTAPNSDLKNNQHKSILNTHEDKTYAFRYLLTKSSLADLLEHLQNEVEILTVDNEEVVECTTTYLDTPDFYFFNRFVDRNTPWQKIAIRTFENLGPHLLEYKCQSDKGWDIISQIELERKEDTFSDFAQDNLFEKTGFTMKQLTEKTAVSFSRIYLIDSKLNESLTLDFDLFAYRNGKNTNIDNVVFAELKQELPSSSSPFVRAFKQLEIKKHGYSKYCTALMLFEPTISKGKELQANVG